MVPFQLNTKMYLTRWRHLSSKKNGGVKYIVKLSVMGADAEPATTIGRLHRQEEKVIEESRIPYTFLRPTSFMQNFVNIYGPGIKSKNAFYMPGGDAKVSFVDVRDIASVAGQSSSYGA
jgi:uncharacterized protein YbjT (DUF2867 family)